KEINMDVQDVDYIRLLVRRGRGGSARFILHTKQNKKVTILHIPLVWLNDRHTTLIAETLQQLTGAEIKRA
ncbi:MAG TPA: hypothetical protein VHB48_11255, partial [Chitinophagaceae bacterium]|nr:hypothetical protein [Chitinophagaceae bacterium]